jgi:hypothetical protein
VERRLDRLEVRYQVDSRTISEASYDVEWAVKWPEMADPDARAAAIREAHHLDDAGMARAIEVALVRCGVDRVNAGVIATLGLEQVVAIAASPEKEIA